MVNKSSAVLKKGRPSSSSARRVFQAPFRPLRRVSRLVKQRSKAAHQHPHLHDGYGSLLDETNDAVTSTRSMRSRQSNIQDLLIASSETDEPSFAEQNIVRRLEVFLRALCVLLLCYCCGVWFPQLFHYMVRTMGYLATAWLTCIVLLIMGAISCKTTSPEEGESLLTHRGEGPRATEEDDEEHDIESHPYYLPEAQPHVALEKFFVIDTATNRRTIPNSQPVPLENDLFQGHMMVMIRTPDVDDPEEALLATAENKPYVNYLRGKQRRFEMQWQLKLKRKPKGRVYFGGELTGEPIKMGMIQRAFVGATMQFVKNRSSNFHYSIMGHTSPDGRYERPHVAFSVESGMNVLVVTKPGERAPTLGQAIEEDAIYMRRRIKSDFIDWNTEDTYTLAFWSAYVDFLEWKIINLPGIRPFHLSSVVGSQPIHLFVYEYVMPEKGMEDRHYRDGLRQCVDLELSNRREMSLGRCAQAWLLTHDGNDTTTRDRLGSDGTDVEIIPRLSLLEDDLLIEEQTIAELGGGMYLRSGDAISLNISSLVPDEDLNGYVGNGGGFAIVQQSTAAATIVIEKVSKSRQVSHHNPSSLIRCGDVVNIQLRGKDEVKYLSTHRGWWLKWVSNEPTKNGFFTIHTQHVGLETSAQSPQSDSQDSYVTLGGSFSLRHKRWENYVVGVTTEESATYGGRLLGLYEPSTVSAHGQYSSERLDMEVSGSNTKESNLAKWVEPILFRAQLSSLTPGGVAGTGSAFTFDFDHLSSEPSGLHLTTSNCSLDIPIWVEMMHRTDRRRQWAYVVRVVVDCEPGDPVSSTSTAFCRLRSGMDLAQIVRATMRLQENHDGSKSEAAGSNGMKNLGFSENQKSRQKGDLEMFDLSVSPFSDSRKHDPQVAADMNVSVGWGGNVSGDDASADEAECLNSSYENLQDLASPTKDRRRRKSSIIDQIAKSVKTGAAAKTGKQVVKKMGKDTVQAGKAIISPVARMANHPKRPPGQEPKKVKPGATGKRRAERDLLAVNRAMKRIGKKTIWLSEPTYIAGQLSQPEQSLRSISHTLSNFSSAIPSTELATKFEEIANSQFAPESELDASFLKGGAFQLGIIPPDEHNLVHDALVARCLWESHWREEWCGVYKTGIVSYASVSKRPSLELSYIDILGVRTLEPNRFGPLPGYPILVIDTGWQCFYLAFPNEESREVFADELNSQVRDFNERRVNDDQKDLWKARFWQGLQDTAEETRSTGNHKWAKVQSGAKLKPRVILNGRRMVFDVESLASPDDDDSTEVDKIESFVSKLTDTALTTTFQSLETDPTAFVDFLDMASRVRSIPLDRLNFSQPVTLCIFSNLYHCLLQHALLLTLNGPLHKRSVGHFFRTSCYEIGGDVFSLVELYHCVLRGNLSRPVSSKNPYLEYPRKSASYSCYTLNHLEPRITFLLNTGDTSCPDAVPVLRPSTLDAQLQQAAKSFLQRNLLIDSTRRTILLPKVCDIYRNDFGDGDVASTLSYCVDFLPAADQSKVFSLAEDVDYKFAPCAETYHSILSRRETLQFV